MVTSPPVAYVASCRPDCSYGVSMATSLQLSTAGLELGIAKCKHKSMNVSAQRQNIPYPCSAYCSPAPAQQAQSACPAGHLLAQPYCRQDCLRTHLRLLLPLLLQSQLCHQGQVCLQRVRCHGFLQPGWRLSAGLLPIQPDLLRLLLAASPASALMRLFFFGC